MAHLSCQENRIDTIFNSVRRDAMKRKARRPMSNKTRREILHLLRRTVRQLLPNASPLLSSYIRRGENMAVKEVERRLRTAREPNQKDLERLRTALQSGPPVEVQNQVRDLLKQALNAFPPALRGARPKLSQEEKTDACARIGKYTTDGFTLAEAVNHVAREKKVSARTVKRAWMERRYERGAQ